MCHRPVADPVPDPPRPDHDRPAFVGELLTVCQTSRFDETVTANVFVRLWPNESLTTARIRYLPLATSLPAFDLPFHVKTVFLSVQTVTGAGLDERTVLPAALRTLNEMVTGSLDQTVVLTVSLYPSLCG